MKPINIYALTRVDNLSLISRLERQMSLRKRFLHVKQWEMKSLKAFTDHVTDCIDDAVSFHFYYSFQIPKLGKEFDLLRISDDMVINIELKSFPIADEGIRKQLIQNRYYLSTLGKSIRSYTYISEENRLLRLTNGGRLIETDFSKLCEDLASQKNCYEGDIEELFIEERYIISPLASPDRFLQGEYFLTSQQIDIKKHILKQISRFRQTHVENDNAVCAQGFTGLPGTGKTLLLYDIAMELSKKQRVCVVHCGSYSDELKKLDERLKRIDFYQCNSDEAYDEEDLNDYTAYLVDEAHMLRKDTLDMIISISKEKQAPVIFSYDCEDIIAEGEMDRSILHAMEKTEGYKNYRLTNRIRTKSELSSYIQAIVQGSRNNHRKDYPSVSLNFANDKTEAERLLKSFMDDGYTYIYDKATSIYDENADISNKEGIIGIENVSFKEYEKVIMIVNSRFNYDDKRCLRSDSDEGRDDGLSPVRNLFHGLNRAKSKIALIIINNEAVFEVFLGIAQGWKV